MNAASDPLFLGTAPAGKRDRRIAIAVVVVLIGAGAVAVPYASLPWAIIPVFVPAYNTALVLIDALTALLLFGQFRELRERSLLVLACGYLFTTIAVAAHGLSFRDAFGPGWLIGGSQTTAWLWLVWHGVFPFFIAAYAIRARSERRSERDRRVPAKDVNDRSLFGALLTVGLALACIWVAIKSDALLPPLMNGDQYRPGVTAPILSLAWFTTFVALGLLLWGTRARRIIDLWLSVVLCAWIIDMALSALLVTGRFQIGFYVGRVYSLLAASLVLGILMKETLSLYGRIVRALQAERENARRAEEAQQQLRASEARYRSLFESIDEGFCVIEMIFDATGAPDDYRLLEVNPAFARHSGLVNAGGRTIRALAPGYEQYWLDIFEDIARSGKPRRFENRSDALGGRWFDVYAFRLGDAERGRVAVLFTDATVRKQTEQVLKEADRRKDEFLATLAHELRNPLAPIQTSLALLARGGSNGSVMTSALDVIRRQVKNLVRLVDDLMEVSRLTRGKIALKTELVDLADIVRNAVETSRPLMEAAQHELKVVLPFEPLTLVADPLRLAQVIANLLNNAAKYTPRSGRIELNVRAEADEAVIEVRDDGVGMTAETLPHIFDMFMQVDADHKPAEGGLGIGLALVKNLVDMHGGTVIARSAGRGMGSQFMIRLPLARVGAPMRLRAEVPMRATAAARRVLVVDDNADAAHSLGQLLEMMGNDVRVALNGRAALQAVQARPPDIVFLDLGMPDVSGYEVAEQIANDPAYAAVRLVALTGWGQDEDRRRTQAAGFDDHLVKPVDLMALEELLARAPTPSARAAS